MRDSLRRSAFGLSIALLTMALAGGVSTAQAQLVINEIMNNPSAVADSAGEWFEIHNPTAAAVDINGWTIRDDDVDSHLIVNGGPLLVPAGGYVVLGNNADSATNGGVTVDYTYGSSWFLANGDDEVILLDLVLTEIDRVEYDGGPTFPDPTGASMALVDPALDNNVGVNWCTSETPFGDGDLGTPGAANDCPVVVPSVVINEIHADPDSTNGDANGDGTAHFSDDEFVEIINTNGGPLDISGWMLSDGFGVRHVFPAGTIIEDQCGVAVFGGGTPTGAFGNMLVQTASTGALGLNNGGDSVVLSDGVNEVAAESYGSEGGDNQSLTRDPDVTGTLPWVKHTLATGSGGALFSPGTRIDGSGFAGCPAPATGWIINEIHADPDSTDGDANGDGTAHFSDDEFVEIVNATGTGVDVSSWTLADGFGVRHVFPSGTVVPDQCGIVIFGGGTPTGAFGNMLVQTASTGALGLNNGGDSVVLSDGVNDVAAVSYGSEGGDNQSLTRDPDLTGGFVKHSIATGSGGALFSPGTMIAGGQFGGCEIIIPTLEIWEIQGSGASSPVEGLTVTTASNVVTAVATNGFFMQTPVKRSDGDVDTSDGIFVFEGAAPSVAVGDLVDVTGQVVEFFGFTEFTSGSLVTVVGTGTLPLAVVFDATVPSPDPTAPSCAIEFECYESMRVDVGLGTVTGPNQRFGTDPIAEVHVTSAPQRTFRETGIAYPGLPGLPIWDGNPEVFELDPDKLGLPNQIIPAGSSFSASGVLGFEFGGYELWPFELTVDPRGLPIPVRPRAADEFTVGSLNMFRFFDDVDDPPDIRAFDGAVRDDQVVSTAEYMRRRAKFTSYILDVLRAPDILAVQEVEKLGVLEDLAADIAAADPAVVYSAYLIEGNDVGTIDIGFLVRDSIAVDTVIQLGKDETFENPSTMIDEILHDRPPLLLQGRHLEQTLVQVLAVHMRSLGGIDDAGDGPRVRQKRYEQANSVADKVQLLQLLDPLTPIVVTGDFNAFEFTDGYVDLVGQIRGVFTAADNLVCASNSCDDLVDPDLSNQVLSLTAEERYSFIFSGDAQVLDHALTSAATDPFLRGFEYGRGNADAAVDLINDGSTSLRSSDHDGLVLYLLADGDLDGVPDAADVCPGTTIPEGVPTVRLGVNRWALVNEDFVFDTTLPPGQQGAVLQRVGKGGGRRPVPFTTGDTAGCSCEQIIEEMDLDDGHIQFGCSTGVMGVWVGLVTP